MTNEKRGLERHVNPADPTGPMLKKRADLSDRAKKPKPPPKEKPPKKGP